MMPFMSKKKKFRFQVNLGLEELASVPFVSGVLFAKVRLNDGGSFADISSREEVHNNCVKWKSSFEFPCKMTASMSSGVLDPCYVRISVRKELKGGKSQQKLGYVDLNLAQFAGGGRVSRRYLLEGYDTKHHRQDNSTIKISVELALTSGDPVFKVPSSHSVTQTSSVTGLPSDPIDLRPCDNHSEDSLASSSSGFSSLTRKGKLSSQMSDGCEIDIPEGLGHSRSASYASQHSRGSGYGSLSHSRPSSSSLTHSRQDSWSKGHSRQDSWSKGHSRQDSWSKGHSRQDSGSLGHSRHNSISSEHTPGHSRTPSSLGSTLERRRVNRCTDWSQIELDHCMEHGKLEESGKEVVVGATRVDAEALVQELIENTDLNATEVDEASGLQLLVQKDGTMALR